MVQTVQMEKMERTERTVKTALLPNSKSERDIGTFPMTMEQTGHSWAKPQVKMGLTELMPFRFSRKLPKMKIISISNCRMIRLFPCPNIIRCLSHSPKPRIFGYWRIKHTRSVIPLQEPDENTVIKALAQDGFRAVVKRRTMQLEPSKSLLRVRFCRARC